MKIHLATFKAKKCIKRYSDFEPRGFSVWLSIGYIFIQFKPKIFLRKRDSQGGIGGISKWITDQNSQISKN